MYYNSNYSKSSLLPQHSPLSPTHSPLTMRRRFIPKLLSLLLTLSLTTAALQNDAVALLTFKSAADLDNKLLYTLNEPFDYCQWRGVQCVQNRVTRFVLQGSGLTGTVPANSLSRLDQVRILSLRNNSLSGPVPDLSTLTNLKTLFLDHNSFSGTFPTSLLSLRSILYVDLARNNFSGTLPSGLAGLDRIVYLRLEWNRFGGSLPALNQTSLQVFNVSGNNFSGPVPATEALAKFGVSSYLWNPNLCGEVVDKKCGGLNSPFFDSSSSSGAGGSSPAQVSQSRIPRRRKHRRVGVVVGFVLAVLILIAAALSMSVVYKRRRNQNQIETKSSSDANFANETHPIDTGLVGFNEKKKETRVPKSGNLIFCEGETAMYDVEHLMRASAELLGRGTIGTTYKAIMRNEMIVTVKRLDAGKMAAVSGQEFEEHMEAVGGLRHPNLVPVRAYFQAKQERLIVYDYQPNGSVHNLIHGSRSTRAKSLHWTSCLKIAEDVAQGLAYIHQASKFIHGNLKSSNVLLGPDFEACLTDYCLYALADFSSANDLMSSGKAPEISKHSHRATSKSDVHSFGILLLELLSGKPPSRHPFLVPSDMADWVRAMREDDDVEDNRLGMLVELACICSLTSPEQRPSMRQVLKMIEEIKETSMVVNNANLAFIEYL